MTSAIGLSLGLMPMSDQDDDVNKIGIKSSQYSKASNNQCQLGLKFNKSILYVTQTTDLCKKTR